MNYLYMQCTRALNLRHWMFISHMFPRALTFQTFMQAFHSEKETYYFIAKRDLL